MKLKHVVTSNFIKTRDLQSFILDLSKLTLDAFDPGLTALYNIHRGAYHALKAMARGNPLTLYSHIFLKGREITEVIIQTKNLIGVKQSMIKISQTYSRVTTLTRYPTLSASAPSDIFHMKIDVVDYNSFL
ncbi:hypothetical protein D8L93_07500 [Sodalis-like symbiont of Bactericera trigonica]|nr:hypothetical protein D8L93_07500 [Sodalis-like symbiont of Bactericera trigonica]